MTMWDEESMRRGLESEMPELVVRVVVVVEVVLALSSKLAPLWLLLLLPPSPPPATALAFPLDRADSPSSFSSFFLLCFPCRGLLKMRLRLDPRSIWHGLA